MLQSCIRSKWPFLVVAGLFYAPQTAPFVARCDLTVDLQMESRPAGRPVAREVRKAEQVVGLRARIWFRVHLDLVAKEHGDRTRPRRLRSSTEDVRLRRGP